LPRGDGRLNIFTDSCAKEFGCVASGITTQEKRRESISGMMTTERDMRYATEKFVADWYNSMDKFFLTNLSRLMEQSAGMYNGQIKDIFVKNLGCDKECIEKRINNVSKWTRGLWNYCPCKNLQDLPFVEQEEAETLESGDFYLVSMPEWIELASQVTEEEYNANPFAEQLNI